jgi:hypothetical protein
MAKKKKTDLLTKTRRELIKFVNDRPKVPLETFEELFTEGIAFSRAERIGHMIESFLDHDCQKK